jgi:hypothetical protein
MSSRGGIEMEGNRDRPRILSCRGGSAGWPVVAVFAGWLGLLAPVSTLVEGLTSIGFVGFFVFMATSASRF